MDKPINGERVSYTTKELLQEIRDGIHGIKGTVARHELRIEMLERQGREHDALARRYIPQFESLVRDLDVKKEVTEALDENQAMLDLRRSDAFTKRQKWIMGVIAFGMFVLNALALGPDVF